MVLQLLEEPGSDSRRAIDQPLALDDRDVREADRATRGVSGVSCGVGELQIQWRFVERVLDLLAQHDPAQRQICAGDAFGKADDVRLDSPVVQREPFAGTSEAGYDLV